MYLLSGIVRTVYLDQRNDSDNNGHIKREAPGWRRKRRWREHEHLYTTRAIPGGEANKSDPTPVVYVLINHFVSSSRAEVGGLEISFPGRAAA
jgi:hypothetical protein